MSTNKFDLTNYIFQNSIEAKRERLRDAEKEYEEEHSKTVSKEEVSIKNDIEMKTSFTLYGLGLGDNAELGHAIPKKNFISKKDLIYNSFIQQVANLEKFPTHEDFVKIRLKYAIRYEDDMGYIVDECKNTGLVLSFLAIPGQEKIIRYNFYVIDTGDKSVLYTATSINTSESFLKALKVITYDFNKELSKRKEEK
jgi:hypothetical protein